MTNCNKCNTEFKEYQYKGILFSMCPRCGTVIISEQNLEKLVSFLGKNAKNIDLFTLPTVEVKNEMRRCSTCNENMEQVFCEGVLLDRCNKYKLLAFDNEELSKYFSIFSTSKITVESNPTFIKKLCSWEYIEKDEIKNNIGGTMKLQSSEKEKGMFRINGFIAAFLHLILAAFAAFGYIATINGMTLFLPLTIAGTLVVMFALGGYCTLTPQTAKVYTLFGKYYGTIRNAGFY